MPTLVTLRLCAYRVRLDLGKPKWDVWCVGAAADADLQVLAGEVGVLWRGSGWIWCGKWPSPSVVQQAAKVVRGQERRHEAARASWGS